MHRNQNSIDSTPKTVLSSNLSSVLEPNPVIHRLSDHFADADLADRDVAALHQRLRDQQEYASVDARTPDKLMTPDVEGSVEAEEEGAARADDGDDRDERDIGDTERKAEGKEGSPEPLPSSPDAKDSPSHSRRYSDADAASLIQRNWVNQNYRKKSSKKQAEKDVDKMSVGSYRSNLEGRGETVELNLPDDQLLYAHLTRASYVFESPLDRFLQSSSEDIQITSSNEDLDLKEPWIPPSIEFAKNNASRFHPRRLMFDRGLYPVIKTTTGRHCVYKGWGEQCDLFHEGSFSSLGQFGPGITNYFKFIKFCFWTFVTISILYIPPLIFAVNGNGDLNELATTTLGNVAPYNSTEYAHIPECQQDAAWTCRVKMENIGLVWESLDILACIVVLVGFLWLRFFEKAEAAHLNRFGVSPADYTVLVSNLPPNCTEADLRVYFARLMNEAVTDIVFIYDDEDDIATFKRRGALVKKRYHLTQQYRYHYAFVNKERKPPHQAPQKTIPEDSGTKDFLEGKLTRKGLLIHLSQERAEVTKAIKLLDRRSKRVNNKEPEKPLNQAYVTFHFHAAKNLAIKKHKVTLWSKLRPDPNIILKDHRLYVSQAPDPEKIIWENIKYSRAECLLRQFFTFVGGMILVVVCMLMVSVTLGYDISAKEKGGTGACPAGFGSWSESRRKQYVEKFPDTLHCFCDIESSDAAGIDGCKGYYEALTVARFFRAATAVCCCASALMVDILLSIMLPFEKHVATDLQEKSRMWRSLFFKIVLYGLVFLFTIGHFDDQLAYNEPRLSTYFTPKWYDTTGQALILTMLFNILSPHAIRIYKYIKYILKQKTVEASRRMIFTQDEMNSMYMGPEFVLSHRYAQLVATFIVLFMYMGSFPIFGFIGVASFYITYWLDKFFFLRYYQTPIRYPATIGLQATALIPYAVVAHLILALWAVSRSRVFDTNQSETSYGNDLYNALSLEAVDPGGLKELVSQRHTVYLAMLLIVVIVAMVLKWIVHHFLFAGSRISQLLCFEFVSKYDFFFSTKLFNKKKLTMSYPRAVKRGYIKGLDNYSILQNHRYKEAFHIDEETANQHRRVRSLLASADRPKQSGAPKPLPEDDVIASRALAMFNLNNGDGPQRTPRDRQPPSNKQNRSGAAGGTTPRDGGITPRDGTHDRSGHKNVQKMKSYESDRQNKDAPFHVVKGEKESRLVSDSYNVRIKQDTDHDPYTNARKKKHRNADNISDLSSSDNASNSDDPTRSPEKPVIYAPLSMKLLQTRQESEEVVQARVLQRFESENYFEQKSSSKSKVKESSKRTKTEEKRPHHRQDTDSIEIPPLALGGLSSGAALNAGSNKPQRNLLREASEELLSAPRPTTQPTQKRPANVPRLGDQSGSFMTSFGSASDGNAVVPRFESNHVRQVDAGVSGLTPRDTPQISHPVLSDSAHPADNIKRSVEDWIADTPRAVIGTPRTGVAVATPRGGGNFSDAGTPRGGGTPTGGQNSDMPPPGKVIRGKRKNKLQNDDAPVLQAVSATGEVSKGKVESSLEPSTSLDQTSSARNAQRVMDMGGPNIDILKPKKSSRKKSSDLSNVIHEADSTPVREHKRNRSDISDPSKKFVPRSVPSFGDKSAASLDERKKATADIDDDDDDESLRSLSPVHLSPVHLSNVTQEGGKDPISHLRDRLRSDDPSGDASDENPSTPRIRVVNGTSALMSQSAPNSIEPKGKAKKTDSFEREKVTDGVSSKRGSKW